MLAKERYCKTIVINQFKSILLILTFYLFLSATSQANFQKELINKYKNTDTLYFDFVQKIGEKVEYGNCYIKYPLLMKCNYKIPKKKILISNGKTIAIIKKKYKKIYYYPLKSTPLFIILDKEKVLNLIKNNEPSKINLNVIEFEFIDERSNKLKIFFDKTSLELKGWQTEDSYSNNVSFIISNLKTNNQIIDDFFKIPKENDL